MILIYSPHQILIILRIQNPMLMRVAPGQLQPYNVKCRLTIQMSVPNVQPPSLSDHEYIVLHSD